MRNPMANLIVKDFRAAWSEKTVAVTSIFLVVMSALITTSPCVASSIASSFMLSMCMLNIFSIEEKYRTERFFASLAVRRRDIVFARYGNLAIIVAVYCVLAVVANHAEILAGNPAAHPVSLGYFALTVSLIAFYSAISFPFYFKLGVLKARAVTILLMIVPMTGIGFLMGLSYTAGFMPSLAAAANSPEIGRAHV
jgi:ABC-type transport system involved in multi-copper enzyme maturation permease subunit